MRYVLLTGLSGAGKTTALRLFEDLGCFCIDNLPPLVMDKFMEFCETMRQGARTVVMSVDIRSGDQFDARKLAETVTMLRESGVDISVLYLDAADETLISRFKETRRDHPLASCNRGLTGAIALERERMQPLRETAATIINTAHMNARELRAQLVTLLADEGLLQMRVELVSFGFKRGLPRDADLVWDVRFLPNPFYVEEIRFQTGLQPLIQAFVLGAEATQEFLRRVEELLHFLLPHYQAEGKQRLVVGVGCTGGAHRSVAIAEELARRLRVTGHDVSITHRDIVYEEESWTHMREPEKGTDA